MARTPPILALLLVLSGCLAERHCLTQADCPEGKICREGECRDECDTNDDCIAPQVCKEHKCTLPAGCQGCFFPNAEMSCDESSCAMLDCHDNYWDHNGEPGDGCEAYCVPVSGLVDQEAACDEVDEDCDGLVDEGFDLATDPAHCGKCNNACPVPEHAEALCVGGECRYTCLEGWYDNNGLPEDGCEAQECEPTSEPTDHEPLCDNKDDDCDGEVDEGWDKSDPASCGTFCVDCHATLENAVPACVTGNCAIQSCVEGYADANGLPGDGCECELTNGGVETCDGLDNDCDGKVDEGLNCCPADMVQVDPVTDCVSEISKPYCIDRHEATLWPTPDCTGEAYNILAPPMAWICEQINDLPAGFPPDVGFTTEETEKVYACSLEGIMPARCVSWYQAKRACENSGKRLCSPEEWQLACQGSGCTEYPYGDDFVWDICNYIDTYKHVDYLDTYEALPTGTMPDCYNDFGVWDISGNVWEHDSAGVGHVRGGAYNCNPAGAPMLESCTHVTTFSDLLDGEGNPTGSRNNVGFRCCK